MSRLAAEWQDECVVWDTFVRLEGTAAIARCDDGLENECCGSPDFFLFSLEAGINTIKIGPLLHWYLPDYHIYKYISRLMLQILLKFATLQIFLQRFLLTSGSLVRSETQKVPFTVSSDACLFYFRPSGSKSILNAYQSWFENVTLLFGRDKWSIHCGFSVELKQMVWILKDVCSFSPLLSDWCL